MSEVLWGEISLQCLPPTPCVREERFIDEPLPGPRLFWGGGRLLGDVPGHGWGINPHGVRSLPPGTISVWLSDLRGFPAEICTGFPGSHIIHGQTDMLIRHMWLHCIAYLLHGQDTYGRILGAPPPHWDSGGAPHQGAWYYYLPSPIHNTSFKCFREVDPAPKNVHSCVFLRGIGSTCVNGALFFQSHPPGVGGWELCGAHITGRISGDG